MADTPQNQPQFPQEAYHTLVGKVHAPVFFDKLASDWGVVPQTDEDRAQLLELAGILRDARQQDIVKSSGASFFKEAADSLKGALQANGFQSDVPTSNERLVKEAAMAAISDPEIAEAALQYGSFLAQMDGVG